MTRDELREMMARGAYAHSANTFAVPWEDLNERTRAVLLKEMDGALAALRDAGLAIVPKVFSEAAHDAGARIIDPWCEDRWAIAGDVYDTMLAAGDLLGETNGS